ncbi:MAG: type II toxin-antitoxin system VapC family toxin [Gemmataceae bacterium]
MSHLLDTNAWVDTLRRGASSKVEARIAAAPPGSVYLCSVVVGELLFGATHRDPKYTASNLAAVAKIRSGATSLPYDDRAAEEYARIREHLSRLGTLIGSNDMMIAAIAITNGLKLVTHNTAEFSRVPGLQLEDWQ